MEPVSGSAEEDELRGDSGRRLHTIEAALLEPELSVTISLHSVLLALVP